MIAALAKGIGKLCLLAVCMAFISAITLLLFGSWLLSWPMLRLSPQNRKVKAMVDLTAAAFVALQAIKPDDEDPPNSA